MLSAMQPIHISEGKKWPWDWDWMLIHTFRSNEWKHPLCQCNMKYLMAKKLINKNAFSVMTKNLNWEFYLRMQLLLKDGMATKDKNFKLYGGSLKNPTFMGEVSRKKQYIGI